MFSLTKEELKPDFALSIPTEAGGIVTFDGRVRIHNQGKTVTKLYYEAFDEMALFQGGIIINQAKMKFAIIDAFCIHRIGELQLGEIAIYVGAMAKHRESAFAAVQYIVDEVKTKVPIWKKEFYVDGETDWVKCLECAKKGIAHHDHFHHV